MRLSELFETLSNRIGLPAADLRLVFKGKLLAEPTLTVSYCNIKDGSTLILFNAPPVHIQGQLPKTERPPSYTEQTHATSEAQLLRKIQLIVDDILDPLHRSVERLSSSTAPAHTSPMAVALSKQEHLSLSQRVLSVMLDLNALDIPASFSGARQQREKGAKSAERLLEQLDAIWPTQRKRDGLFVPSPPRSPTSSARPQDTDGRKHPETSTEHDLMQRIQSIVEDTLSGLHVPVDSFVWQATTSRRTSSTHASQMGLALQKEGRRLNELLMRGLLYLDELHIHTEWKDARRQRKEGVLAVQQVLDRVDEAWSRRFEQDTSNTPLPSFRTSANPQTSHGDDQTEPTSEQVLVHHIRSLVDGILSPLAAPVASFISQATQSQNSSPLLAATHHVLQREHGRLSEMLLHGLLELDGLKPEEGWKEARQQRKAGVRAIQRLLDEVDEAWSKLTLSASSSRSCRPLPTPSKDPTVPKSSAQSGSSDEEIVAQRIQSLTEEMISRLRPSVALFISQATSRQPSLLEAYAASVALEREYSRLSDILLRGLLDLDGMSLQPEWTRSLQERNKGVVAIQKVMDELDEAWAMSKGEISSSKTNRPLPTYASDSLTAGAPSQPESTPEQVLVQRILSTVEGILSPLTAPVELLISRVTAPQTSSSADWFSDPELQKEHARLNGILLRGLLEMNGLDFPVAWSQARRHKTEGIRAIQKIMTDLGNA